MNVVLDDAVEVYVKTQKPRKEIGECAHSLTTLKVVLTITLHMFNARPQQGRLMLKGDNITLIQTVQS